MSLLMNHLSTDRLSQLIQDLPWYHTLTFPNGMKTSGVYDNQPTLSHYCLPESLAGKTVVDVGTADGFFTFELAKCGAKVTAIDINPFDGTVTTAASPTHYEKQVRKFTIFSEMMERYPDVLELLQMQGINRFMIARDLMQLEVEYKNASIYDLKALGQKYDLVLCGDLIEHLKNPLEALENLVYATREQCIIALSGALDDSASSSNKAKFIRRIAQMLKVPLLSVAPQQAVEYLGNSGGSGFFRFHPLAFQNALLASGFRRVEIVSKFPLFNQNHHITNQHAIFHCFV